MDRLAYQNMTIKNKTFTDNHMNHSPTMNQFSQPIGQITSKSKINTMVNNYYLERQAKNSTNYGDFISALNSNIIEDQHRTEVNNDQYFSDQPSGDNFQRVYHPTLLTDQEKNFNNADRCGLGTRDRQADAIAKNKNTSHIMTPLPKLNYPQGYDKLEPLKMDMTSQLDSQFNVLTSTDMEQQIALLKKNNEKCEPLANSNVTDEFMRPTHDLFDPQVNYMNQQIYQLSTQIQPQHSSDCLRMLGFQRPISSNHISPQQQQRPFDQYQRTPQICQTQICQPQRQNKKKSTKK